jgi:heme-degrading monooxygenase HmoA
MMSQKPKKAKAITFATEEPMRFYVPENDEINLKKLEKKYEKNPFVFDNTDNAILSLQLPTKTKKQVIGNIKDIGVTDVMTGEVIGGNFLWTNKQVDEEQFAKVYLKEMHHLYGLKRTGLQTLHYLLSKLEPNTDLVYIYYPDMQDFCGWTNKRTCYAGLKELIAHKFIAPSLMTGWWFINPQIIFNGNRLTLITNYTKKGTNEQQDDIHMLG